MNGQQQRVTQAWNFKFVGQGIITKNNRAYEERDAALAEIQLEHPDWVLEWWNFSEFHLGPVLGTFDAHPPGL